MIASADRLKYLLEVLNTSNDTFNAFDWTRKALGRNPDASDVLVTQSQLNMLYLLGFVQKITKYHGKSPRHLYKREDSYITLRKFE